MSLQEHKLTDYAVSIAGLPDKIENKAQWLKQQFDARTDSEVRDKHNSLIDALDEDLAGRPTNESMASAIDEKVVELGAGDMAQKIYDPEKKKQDIFAYADAVRNYAQQVKEDSEQRDKGLKDYVDRISAGGESIKCGPAETVTFTAGANRLESVAVSGFTTQTGTGDPAPDNVRPIQNAGTCNKKLVLTGAESWNWGASNGGHRGLLGLSGSPVDAAAGIWCTDAKAGYTTAPDTVQVSGKTLFLRLSRFDAEESADAFKAYLAQRYAAGDPVTVAYQDTTAAGTYYTGLAVQQNGAYRCEIIRLADRLHAGDTLETNVQSEYDAYAEFDGSSDENWILESGGTTGSSGSKWFSIKFTGPQIKNITTTEVPEAASNSLLADSSQNTYTAKAEDTFSLAYSSGNILQVRIAGISTVEALKTHLQSHPLRVFYKSVSSGNGLMVKQERHARRTQVLTGDETISKTDSDDKTYFSLIGSNVKTPSSTSKVGGVISSMFVAASQNDLTSGDYRVCISSAGNFLFFFDASTKTVDQAKQVLKEKYAAGTPVTIEYDLASPEVYADEPVQPQNPAGTCTLSGESGTRLTATVSPPVGCVNGKSGASITLTKADIGLSNVDNTPDAQKNVKGLAVEQTDVITGLPTGLYYYKANTPGAPKTVDGLLLSLVHAPFGVQLAFPTNSGIYFRWAVDNFSEWVRLDQ